MEAASRSALDVVALKRVALLDVEKKRLYASTIALQKEKARVVEERDTEAQARKTAEAMA